MHDNYDDASLSKFNDDDASLCKFNDEQVHDNYDGLYVLFFMINYIIL